MILHEEFRVNLKVENLRWLLKNSLIIRNLRTIIHRFSTLFKREGNGRQEIIIPREIG